MGILRTDTEKQRVGAEWGEMCLCPWVRPYLLRGSSTGGGIPEVSGGALASRDRQQGTFSSRVLHPVPHLPSLSLPWLLWPVLREQPVLADPTHHLHPPPPLPAVVLICCQVDSLLCPRWPHVQSPCPVASSEVQSTTLRGADWCISQCPGLLSRDPFSKKKFILEDYCFTMLC